MDAIGRTASPHINGDVNEHESHVFFSHDNNSLKRSIFVNGTITAIYYNKHQNNCLKLCCSAVVVYSAHIYTRLCVVSVIFLLIHIATANKSWFSLRIIVALNVCFGFISIFVPGWWSVCVCVNIDQNIALVFLFV